MEYNNSYFLGTDKEIRDKFFSSIKKVRDIIASTMGAKGQSVLILTELGFPRVTNDGITVLESLHFEDPIDQLVVSLAKDVSAKTNHECGDFSSGSWVLAGEFIVDKLEFSKETDELINKVVEYIKLSAKEVSNVKDLINVATVSSKDEVLGKVIGELSWELTTNNSVTLKPSSTEEHYSELIDGLSINAYFAAKEFYVSQKETVLEPKIMLVNDEIVSFNQIEGIYNAITDDWKLPQEERKELNKLDYIIIAKSFAQEVINSVAQLNKQHGFNIRLANINIPPSIANDTFENLALMTNGSVCGGKSSLPLLKGRKGPLYDINNYGTCQEVRISLFPNQEFILIIDKKVKTTKMFKERVAELKIKIDNKETPKHMIDLYKILINQIDGKVANLYIAGDGNVERQHLILKAEDAVNACKSAKEFGIVPGGSVILRDAAKLIEDKNPRLATSLSSLYRYILENAKLDTNTEFEQNNGYNVITGESGNMFDMNIVDPAKGFIHGIKNAYSLAKTLSDSSTLIIKLPEKKKE